MAAPTSDTLLLATPTGADNLEVIRVRVPDNLSREDLFLHILADIPAGEPQPYALNLDSLSAAVVTAAGGR
ncbi:hypothetical protein [Corynebacterium sp. AOP12-C2-36]|uniref:hypothetical protein n=1 Tax=Corynebacterium sp. AOP12-C2-36 TaxID=3457723 RepID=UPI00403402B2